MESAIVPQNATAEVRPAPNTLLKPPNRPTAEPLGFCNMGPRPPARTAAHTNNATPTARRNGDPQVSRNLIESMPRRTIHTFIAQNTMKQRNSPVLSPTKAGRICGSVAIPGNSTSTSL